MPLDDALKLDDVRSIIMRYPAWLRRLTRIQTPIIQPVPARQKTEKPFGVLLPRNGKPAGVDPQPAFGARPNKKRQRRVS